MKFNITKKLRFKSEHLRLNQLINLPKYIKTLQFLINYIVSKK